MINKSTEDLNNSCFLKLLEKCNLCPIIRSLKNSYPKNNFFAASRRTGSPLRYDRRVVARG